jgi:hypothetical protein
MFKLFSNILTLLIAGVTFVCPVALIKECFILQSNQRRGKDQFYITMAIDKVLKDLIMSWVTTLHSQLVFSWIYNHGYRSQPFMLVEKKSLWRKNCLDLYFLLLFFFFLIWITSSGLITIQLLSMSLVLMQCFDWLFFQQENKKVPHDYKTRS